MSSDWGVNCVSSTEQTAAWNYGANFGGPTKSSWTSGADSITMGKSDSWSNKGMFGKYAVTTDNYAYEEGGLGSGSADNKYEIHMCGGGEGSSTTTSSNYKYGPKFCLG